ncbi:hypothetical protein DL546_008630 [Coniochaeta pulveracea]|uniref:Uncharacterized protein n=1 Tax=Coniochaeta pulveracea TaxID=177199 RepID=A0A420YEK7_9PEZI|nr:hypothetical protein DL546_008630 [Coniochaeta pulveracea]
MGHHEDTAMEDPFFKYGTCHTEFATGLQARDNYYLATGHYPPFYECDRCSEVFLDSQAKWSYMLEHNHCAYEYKRYGETYLDEEDHRIWTETSEDGPIWAFLLRLTSNLNTAKRISKKSIKLFTPKELEGQGNELIHISHRIWNETPEEGPLWAFLLGLASNLNTAKRNSISHRIWTKTLEDGSIWAFLLGLTSSLNTAKRISKKSTSRR